MSCKIIEFSKFNNKKNNTVFQNIQQIIDGFRFELETFQKSNTTIEGYIIYINKFIKDNNIKSIKDLGQLEEYLFYTNYIAKLQKECKNSTINKSLSILNVFCNYLKLQKLIDDNIVPNIQRLPEEKSDISYFNDDEIQKILSHMKKRIYQHHNRKIDHINAHREYVMVALMVTLGLRVSECCNIRTYDVDMIDMTISIRGKGYKGKISRILAIPESVVDIMQKWESLREEIEVDYSSQDYYFISALTKNAVKRLSIEKRLKLIGEELGIDSVHPHKFRHSYGTNAIHKNELTIYEASECLGHASIKTTEKFYVAQNKDALMKTRYSGNKYQF